MSTHFWQKYLWSIGVVLCCGCTIAMNETEKPAPISIPQSLKPAQPLIDLSKISVGMSMDQVKAAIGEELIVGYTVKEEGQTTPITVKSLQKEETLNIKGFSYQVLYYFTYIVRSDDQITDDEITPLVFENGVLIAKSWDELNKIQSTP